MIYFIQPTEGGPVKIGYSDDVEARHRQLEGHYGKPLVILATMPGGPDEEAEIHGRFAHLRFDRPYVRGPQIEQFRPTAELMAFIGRPLLVGANPDAVEAMDTVGRVAAVVLKDTPEYRDWLTGLSEATLIPVATIVRDALARWAADRGLAGPPSGPSKSQRKVGDRGNTPKQAPKGKGKAAGGN